MGKKLRTYGTYNIKENPERCIENVPDGGRSVSCHQCTRKRGHGPDGLYCKQHGKIELERREWRKKMGW